MHVFEVVELEEQSIAGLPGWSLTQERRRWIARDPNGVVRASGRVRGTVEANAKEFAARASSATPSNREQPRDSERRGNRSDARRANRNPVADPSQRSAVDRGDSERGRTRPDGRIEPTISRDNDSGNRSDSRRDSRLRALHNEVPTIDQLTDAERRAYNRGESFKREVTGTGGRKIEINVTPDMVDEQTRIRGGNTGRLRSDNRNPSLDPNVDTSKDLPKDLLSKLWDGLKESRLLKVVKAFFTVRGAVAINTAINASAVEDTLDHLMKAIKEDAAGVSEADRQAFLDGIVAGNFTPRVSRAYLESVERFTQLFLEAVISVILAGGWLAFILLTGFSLGTGFVGAVLSMVAGGVVVYGGTTALYSLFESVGINDWIENNISLKVFQPHIVLSVAMGIDGMQNWFGEGFDWLTSWSGWNAGDIVRDSVMYNESNSGTVTPNQAKEIVKDFIKSDPKLLQAYNDGKEEAKEIMRSGAPEEESN